MVGTKFFINLLIVAAVCMFILSITCFTLAFSRKGRNAMKWKQRPRSHLEADNMPVAHSSPYTGRKQMASDAALYKALENPSTGPNSPRNSFTKRDSVEVDGLGLPVPVVHRRGDPEAPSTYTGKVNIEKADRLLDVDTAPLSDMDAVNHLNELKLQLAAVEFELAQNPMRRKRDLGYMLSKKIVRNNRKYDDNEDYVIRSKVEYLSDLVDIKKNI